MQFFLQNAPITIRESPRGHSPGYGMKKLTGAGGKVDSKYAYNIENEKQENR